MFLILDLSSLQYRNTLMAHWKTTLFSHSVCVSRFSTSTCRPHTLQSFPPQDFDHIQRALRFKVTNWGVMLKRNNGQIKTSLCQIPLLFAPKPMFNTASLLVESTLWSQNGNPLEYICEISEWWVWQRFSPPTSKHQIRVYLMKERCSSLHCEQGGLSPFWH